MVGFTRRRLDTSCERPDRSACAGLSLFSQPPPALAQRVPAARITPLPAAEWTEAHKEALGTRARGEDTLDVFQTCLRNLELCRTWMPFTNYILSPQLSIPARERELLIPEDWLSLPLGLRMGAARAARSARRPHGRRGRTDPQGP